MDKKYKGKRMSYKVNIIQDTIESLKKYPQRDKTINSIQISFAQSN